MRLLYTLKYGQNIYEVIAKNFYCALWELRSQLQENIQENQVRIQSVIQLENRSVNEETTLR